MKPGDSVRLKSDDPPTFGTWNNDMRLDIPDELVTALDECLAHNEDAQETIRRLRVK